MPNATSAIKLSASKLGAMFTTLIELVASLWGSARVASSTDLCWC
jgi:hypothetical protein